jgi:hypothetical protein
MSDTNRVSLRFVEEATYGTTPNTPYLKAIPFTAASDLGQTPETVVSDIIRDDRQVSDLILVGSSAAGGFDTELAYEVHDELLEGVMYSTWGSPGTAASGADVVVTADEIQSAANIDLADGADLGELNAGDIVSLVGFIDADYKVNKEYEVASSLSAAITTATVDNITATTTADVKTLTVVGKSGTITVAASLITTPTGWGAQLGLEEGDWIRVSGTGAGTYRVTGAVTTTTIPIANGNAEGPATGVIRTGAQLSNGVTQKSFTLERAYNDQASVLYEYLRGMVAGTFSLSASAKSLITSSFGFTGSTQEYTTSRVSGTVEKTATSSGSFQVLNSSSNVGDLSENGTPISGNNFVTEATIEVDNGLRERNAVGSLGAVSIGAGEFMVTGTLNTYFDNKTLADKVVNNTLTSISLSFTDTAGNWLVFDMPKVKFAEGSPEVGNKNDDVYLNLSYQAILDATAGHTLRITRFSA